MNNGSKQTPLLQVRDLTTSFNIEGNSLQAVRGVDFDLHSGQTLGIIGESGCGKSVTSLSILRLIAKPGGNIDSGEVIYQGKNILEQDIHEFRKLRGKEIAMIFQEPMSSLNPVLTIGEQLMETMLFHKIATKKEAWQRSIELLEEVGLSDPASRLLNYPHQLSGGMKQRVMIAMALSCNPKILIADEPTTALDVTIQAQILQLLQKIQKKHNMSLIMITHDLGVVSQVCDEVVVMYAGKVVEKAPVAELFEKPAHPYTKGLMKSVMSILDSKDKELYTIDGIVPQLNELPVGCPFQNRCPYKQELCEIEMPKLKEYSQNRTVACHYSLN